MVDATTTDKTSPDEIWADFIDQAASCRTDYRSSAIKVDLSG